MALVVSEEVSVSALFTVWARTLLLDLLALFITPVASSLSYAREMYCLLVCYSSPWNY